MKCSILKLRLFILLAVIMLFSYACNNMYKVLDFKVFKITVPKQWNYKEQKGIDSFAGDISTGKSALSFDYSTMGYASFGPESEDEITTHNIQIDTSETHIRKTVWPKITGRGRTGFFIKSCKGTLSFNLNGSNLSAVEQNEALRAFKTLVFTPDISFKK